MSIDYVWNTLYCLQVNNLCSWYAILSIGSANLQPWNQTELEDIVQNLNKIA